LEQAGFTINKVISTLFQKPDRVEYMELPRTGYSAGAGFTVVVAGRK
jgi:dienelactone hydrolase